jgi:hypothetical protein
MIPGPLGPELPDIRIAIVSTDVGAGPDTVGTCNYLGDKGRFLVKPDCGLDKNVAHWLAAQENGTKTNFRGNLETVFACMAELGTNGCGFEHHLQAVRAALSKENPENQNFLRPDAYLGIIFLTDEDDCSAPHDTDLFLSTPDGHSPNLVCSLEGHTCKGSKVPAMENFSALMNSECKATERGRTKLIAVEDFVKYVKDLKAPRNDRIIVAAIFGYSAQDGAQYRVIRQRNSVSMQPELEVAPICQSQNGSAQPGVRLKAFIESFGDFGTMRSICEGELAPALQSIAKLIGRKIGTTCVEAPLVDTVPGGALDPDCSITDRRPMGSGFVDVPLPACSRSGGMKPCWELLRDPVCTASGLKVNIQRDGMPPSGTILAMKCQTCAREGDTRCPKVQ